MSFGFGPEWARHTQCCAKPVGCTNMSGQCRMLGHPWKRWHRETYGQQAAMPGSEDRVTIAAQLFEVSAADVADTSDDYYTPYWIFDAAGLVFDLDVSAPVDPSRRTCPARRYLTVLDDGLTAPWDGLVWMNPPYSRITPWVDKFVSHGHGLALVPILKRVPWQGTLLRAADAVTFVSAYFGRPDGNQAAPSFPLVVAGCGPGTIAAVSRIAAADKYAGGAYHVKPQVE